MIERKNTPVTMIGDDPQTLETLQGVFAHAGCCTYEQAAGMDWDEPPALVVVDLDADPDEGLQISRQVTEAGPAALIALASAETLERTQAAYQAGCGAVLVKPVHPEELRRAAVAASIRREDLLKLRELNTRLQQEAAERRVAEVAYRESEARYRTLVDRMPDAVLVSEKDRIVFINQAGARMLGYEEPSWLVGRSVFEFVIPEHHEIIRERVRKFSLEGPIGRMFLTCLGPEGQKFIIETTTTPVMYAAQKMALTVARDVTEHKLVEQALQESESKFRSIVEQSADGIALLDGEGRVIEWNHALEEISGLERSQAVGRPLGELPLNLMVDEMKFPELASGIQASILTLLTGDRSNWAESLIEFDIHRPDGDCRRIQSRIFKVESGQTRMAGAVLRDITQNKLAEEALRRAHAELEQRVIERTAELAEANESLRKTLDELESAYDETRRRAREMEILAEILSSLRQATTQAEVLPILIDKTMQILGPDDITLSLEQEGVLSAAAGQGMDWLRQGLLCARTQCWLWETPQPYFKDDAGGGEPPAGQPYEACPLHGKLAAFAALPLRTTEKMIGVLHVGYAEPHAFTSSERQLLLAIADMSGNALHRAAVMEERTRLSREIHDSVTQTVYSLTLFTEAARQHASAGEIERAQQRLAQVNELAQQALREMRLMVHELRPPSLADEGLAGALHRRLNAVERRAGIQARLIVDDLVNLPSFYEEELYRVALEALNNAIKHARPQSIRIRLRTVNQHLEMEIVDDGIGFDLETVSGRSGMGLSTMQERVARIGGELQVTSSPGKGTRVMVLVPLSAVEGGS